MENQINQNKFIAQADAGRLPFADDSADLVFGSPPYMDARTYGIGAQRGVGAWIDFMLKCTAEAVRVSRGLVLWVVGGVTRKHCYQPGCEGLLYEWWRRGGRCWRPCFWHRSGIPGSGGRQWLRADIEYVLCFTKCKAYIPWAENTANGHPPKWAPGGAMSYRDAEGHRKNDRDMWGNTLEENRTGAEGKNADGTRKCRPPGSTRRADGTINKDKRRLGRGNANGIPGSTKGQCLGRKVGRHKSAGEEGEQEYDYLPPKIANPGTLIKGIKVGGGLMGHKLAHENEAPFPQKLAEWFIRSHCPPGGICLDPFSGSGTTVAAAIALGRRGIGLDIRFNQCELARMRCNDIQMVLY